MRVHLRLVTFAAALVAAMAAVPIRAADAVLPPPKPRTALGGDDLWRLREPEVRGEGRNDTGAPLAVRLVYPPLVAPR